MSEISTSKMTLDMELHLFRHELTDSAKIRMKEKKIFDDKQKSICDTNHNIWSLIHNKLLMDLLPGIFKYLPLSTMLKVQLVCHKFFSIIQSIVPIGMIYIDDNYIENLFTINVRRQNKLLQLVWFNMHTIQFNCPGTFGLEKFGHRFGPPNPPIRPDINEIIPPKLSTVTMHIEYPYQLEFLFEFNIKKINLIIECCSNKDKCWICQYDVVADVCARLRKNCNTLALYHNKKKVKLYYY